MRAHRNATHRPLYPHRDYTNEKVIAINDGSGAVVHYSDRYTNSI